VGGTEAVHPERAPAKLKGTKRWSRRSAHTVEALTAPISNPSAIGSGRYKPGGCSLVRERGEKLGQVFLRRLVDEPAFRIKTHVRLRHE
jgi:hypothetical protein